MWAADHYGLGLTKSIHFSQTYMYAYAHTQKNNFYIFVGSDLDL